MSWRLGRVSGTIEVDLPAATGFLKGYRFRRQVEDIVDMPDARSISCFAFSANDGTLSRRAREPEFAGLTEDEVARIEATYAEAFSG